MSIYTLQARDLFSHKFKYVGLGLSAVSVLYALVHHVAGTTLIFEDLHVPKITFAAGLMIAISSRESFEDERIQQIRYHVHYILSMMFIGVIFFGEMDGEAISMFNPLCAFLTVYLLIFHFIYYYNADWIIKYRNTFWFIILIILIVLFISFDVLWAA